MSPDWAGWLVLHAAIMTLMFGALLFVAVLGLQAGARWVLRRWWTR